MRVTARSAGMEEHAVFEHMTGGRALRIGGRLERGLSLSIASLALCLFTVHAPAATLQVGCEQETVGVPGWTGPLLVTYDGEDSGTLSVKSDHTDLSLDATYRTRPEDGAKVIDGAGEIAATMPDLALLDACTAARVPADFKDDADFYNVIEHVLPGRDAAECEPCSDQGDRARRHLPAGRRNHRDQTHLSDGVDGSRRDHVHRDIPEELQARRWSLGRRDCLARS